MKSKVINRVLRVTAGGFHCWCDCGKYGIIKKENRNVPDVLFKQFLETSNPLLIVNREEFTEEEFKMVEVGGIVQMGSDPVELSWWKRLLLFIKKLWHTKT